MIALTGTITMSMIKAEFGGSDPDNLSEYYAGGLYVPAGTINAAGIAIPSSGLITMSMFRGQVKGFVFAPTLPNSTTNYDLHAQAIAAGWDGTTPLVANVTLAVGATVYSTSTSTPAFTIASIPSGSIVRLTIPSGSAIYGAGGQGGAGGNVPSTTATAAQLAGSPGLAGGTALLTNYATTLTINGGIAGGYGGGGGGGGTYGNNGGFLNYIAGSGGGGGLPYGAGGAAGVETPAGGSNGQPGSAASLTLSGNGGSGTSNGTLRNGNGGQGSVVGYAASSSGSGNVNGAGGAAGAQGYWVQGYSYLTIVGTGGRVGNVS